MYMGENSFSDNLIESYMCKTKRRAEKEHLSSVLSPTNWNAQPNTRYCSQNSVHLRTCSREQRSWSNSEGQEQHSRYRAPSVGLDTPQCAETKGGGSFLQDGPPPHPLSQGPAGSGQSHGAGSQSTTARVRRGTTGQQQEIQRANPTTFLEWRR